MPFPDCLAPSHRLYIEAVHEHGHQTVAAEALGVALGTIINGLKKARLRAGVKTTPELLDLYFQHTKRRPK